MKKSSLNEVLIRTNRVLVLGLLGWAGTASLQAQTTNAPEEMKPVVVTGTYLESANAADTLNVTTVEATSPVNQGMSTLADMLRTRVPQYGGPGNLNPAFGNGGDGNSYVSLRGLPGNNTLVLVNGRRTAISALNLIPDAAVERVEILNDGAGAIYGADAVAGVINVIMKKDYQGTMLSAYGSINNASASVNETKWQMLTGMANEKAHFVFSSEYETANGLYSPDRSVPALANGTSATGNPGTTYNASEGLPSGFVALPWYVNPNVTRGLTNASQIPAGFNPLAAVPSTAKNAAIAASNAILGASSPVLYGNGPRFPYPLYTTLYRPYEKYDFSGSFEYKLINDSVKLFSDAYYVNYQSESQLAPSPLSGLSVPANNYWVSQVFPSMAGTTNQLTQNYRAVELGPRIYKNNFDEFRFDGGLRGKISDSTWNWEAGYLYDKNTQLQTASGGLVYSKLDTLLQDTTSGAWNPFGYTPIGGSSDVNGNTVLALADSAYTRWINLVQSFDLRAGGNVVELPAGPLAISAGMDSRHENFDQIPDLATKDGLIYPFNTTPPLAAMRTIWAGYGEAVIPIAGKDFNIPLVSEFDISPAARYENYSDVGDTGVKPRVSFRWKPLESEALNFRGSFAQGYTAPTFTELYTPAYQDFDQFYNPYTQVTEQAADGCYHTGNINLKPVYSDTYLVGGTWSPKFDKDLTVGIDYYRIKQSGVIFESVDYSVQQWYGYGGNSNPSNPYGPNAAPSPQNPAGTQVAYNDTTGQFEQIRNVSPINSGNRLTDGIDFQVSQLLRNDWGNITFTGLATRMISFQQQDVPNGPVNSYIDRYWGNGAAFSDTSYPLWRANLSALYEYKRYTAAVNFNYVAGYKENYNDVEYDVNCYPTFDLRLGYKIPVIEANFMFGINNLANRNPSIVLSSFENNFDRAVANPQGRTFFFSMSKEF